MAKTIELIPASYKASKLYSQLPVGGSGDFAVTVAGSGNTRVNKAGLIEVTATNVPRLDYADGSCPAYLQEPASENLVTYSEDFSDASWTKSNLNTSGSPSWINTALSPDGSVNASLLIPDTNPSSSHALARLTTLSAGTYTYSIFAKKGGYKYISLSSVSTSVVWCNSVFDLDLGIVSQETIGGGTPLYTLSSSIVDYGNDWYRISITFAAPNPNFSVNVLLSDTPTPTIQNFGEIFFVGDNTNGVYIFGAQLEQQSYATSYMPRLDATAVTRGQGTATGAGDSSSINSTEGALIVEAKALSDDGTSRNMALIADVSNFVKLVYSSTSNRVDFVCFSGGAISCNIVKVITDTTVKNKLVLSYEQDNFNFFINGIKVGNDPLGNTPIGLSQLSLNDEGGGSPFNGKIKYLAVEDTALTDLEAEAESGYNSWSAMAQQLEYTIE